MKVLERKDLKNLTGGMASVESIDGADCCTAKCKNGTTQSCDAGSGLCSAYDYTSDHDGSVICNGYTFNC